MAKKALIATLFVLLLGVTVLTLPTEAQVVFSDNISIDVETAVTSEEKSTGLMDKENLPEDKGMVFIYQDKDYRSFWMKNTSIPLDIIFVDSSQEIINIEQADPEPNKSADELIRYKSKEPAKYVLEVNQGFSKRNNIEKGDKVNLEYSKIRSRLKSVF